MFLELNKYWLIFKTNIKTYPAQNKYGSYLFCFYHKEAVCYFSACHWTHSLPALTEISAGLAWHEFCQFNFAAFNKYLRWEGSVTEIFGWVTAALAASANLLGAATRGVCVCGWQKVWLLKNSPLIYRGGCILQHRNMLYKSPEAWDHVETLQLTSGVGFRTRSRARYRRVWISWVFALRPIGNCHEFYKDVPPPEAFVNFIFRSANNLWAY